VKVVYNGRQRTELAAVLVFYYVQPRTAADSGQKDDDLFVCQHCNKPNVVSSFIRSQLSPCEFQ